MLGNNDIDDVRWLCSLTGSELDLLMGLKNMVNMRAKKIGHETLAKKFDLRMLRALSLIFMKHLKEQLKDVQVASGFDCNVLKENLIGSFASMTIEDLYPYICSDKRKRIAEPVQWCALIQDLSARPEGPPHLRITGIHQQKEVLDQMAHILSEEAEKLDLPFQFNPVVSTLQNLDFDKLRVKTGEALAISSVLQLHTLLASGNDVTKKPLRFAHMNQNTLRELLEKDHMIKSHSPSHDSASLSSLSSPSIDNFLSALWGLPQGYGGNRARF